MKTARLQLFHPPGLTETAADLLYLRLDTANKPLTGGLTWDADDSYEVAEPAVGLAKIYSRKLSIGDKATQTTPTAFNPVILDFQSSAATRTIDGLRILVENTDGGVTSFGRGLYMKLVNRSLFDGEMLKIERDTSNVAAATLPAGLVIGDSYATGEVTGATGASITLASTGAVRATNLTALLLGATGASSTNVALSLQTGDVTFAAGTQLLAGIENQNLLDKTAAEAITGLHNFSGAAGAGGLTDYDITVGDVTTPDYGLMLVGDALMGRTSYNVASLDLDGAVIFRNMGGPVTGQVEFVWTESAGSGVIRFALPKSGVGNATYNPRSMLLAGPAVNDDDIVTVGYWQTNNSIFDKLACDTAVSGADLGVQNDIQLHGDLFVDSIKESTTAAGITVGNTLDLTGNDLDNLSTVTFNADADAVFGSLAKGADKFHFAQASAAAATPRAAFRGLHFVDDTNGDFFAGSTPISGLEIFYSQITVRANSSETDGSDFATSFYQGNWGSGTTPDYPFIEMNYFVGDGTVGNLPVGEDGATYIFDGTVTFGRYDNSLISPASNQGLGGSGIFLASRRQNAGTLLQNVDEKFVIRTMAGSAMAATHITDIVLAGTRLTDFYPDSDVTVNLGTIANGWLDGHCGGFLLGTVAKTANYTLAAGDHLVTCDASSASFTITLPAAASHPGRIYHIKKTDASANTVTVDGNASETIDGATTAVITTQYESIMIQCDASNWHII